MTMRIAMLLLALLGGQDDAGDRATPAPAVQQPALVETARSAVEVRARAASLQADTQAFDAIVEDLEGALDVLRAPMPPKPRSLSDVRFVDMHRAPEELQRGREYLDAWRARETARAHAAELLESGARLVETVPDARAEWYDDLVAERPRLIELQRLVARGEVRERDLGLDAGSVAALVDLTAGWFAGRDEMRAAWDEDLARFDAAARELEAIPEPDPEDVRRARRVELALSTISEAVAAETELLERLADAPLETLPAEVDRLWDEWNARLSSAVGAGDGFAEALAEFRGVGAERDANAAPRVGEVPEGDALYEVRRAQRDVDYSTALIAWYEADRALESRMEAALDALVAAADDATRRHAAVSRQGARVLSAVQLFRDRAAEAGADAPDLPAEVDVQVVWDDWRGLQTEQADRLEALEAARAQDLQRVPDERLEEEREALRQAEQRLSTERSHAEFLAGMEARSDAELVALLAPGGGIEAELERLDGELEGLGVRLSDADAQCVAIAEAVRAIESPYSRQIVKRRENRKAEIERELLALTGGEVLPDLSKSELEAGPDDKVGGDARKALTDPPGGAPLEVARWEQTRLEKQQEFTRLLLGYYKQLDNARAELERAAEERVALGAEREALMAERLRQQKMRYAAANELSNRVARGEATAGDLADLDAWTASDDVTRVGEELRDLRDADREFLARVEYLQHRLETFAILGPVVQSVCDSADARASMIGTPVSRMTSALTTVEDLDTVSAKNLKFEADSRKAAEDGSFERLWKRFSSDEVQRRFEEPLDAYYLELANVERVLEELGEAEVAYGRIAETWNEDRERLLPARDSSRQVIAQREFDYHAARYAASVTRFPDSRNRIEQAFRAAFGHDLPYRLEVDLSELEESADALFGAEMRLTAQDALRHDLERLLSKTGIELEVSWYREQVSRVRAMLERARNDEADLRRRIDDLRDRYRDRLKRNATIGVVITLCIPLLAWIVVVAMRRFAKRFEYDVVGELGEHDSDRKRRMRTLARTFTAALSVFVWALAAVYVFAQLGLDITPLIASASVVGLAVAFGAQALIKDFFYGFFILLENQFTVGDVVKLGDISGTVEKISLRITILRDLKGVVHYIPNGSIGQVSNMTQGWARVVLEVSVPYREDPDRATRVLEEVLAEFYADEQWSPFILEPPVVAGVQNLTERSIDIRLMIKTRPGRQWEVAREARRRIKQRLDREGIESPFPHRVIHHVHQGGADRDAIGEVDGDDLGA